MIRTTLKMLVRTALAVTALVAAGTLLTPVRTVGALDGAAAPAVDHEAWLTALTGTHRQLFDSPAPSGGIMLVHIMNYFDTYNKAYQVPDSDIEAIGTFYGATTFHGLNDAMWAKYGLGEFLAGIGQDVAPSKVNPWRAAPQVLGMSLPQASIESLQGRGATFILCNNALQIFSGLLAQQRGLDPKAVYEDMKANILPGVALVPAMVIAIEKAQEAGFTYQRQ